MFTLTPHMRTLLKEEGYRVEPAPGGNLWIAFGLDPGRAIRDGFPSEDAALLECWFDLTDRLVASAIQYGLITVVDDEAPF